MTIASTSAHGGQSGSMEVGYTSFQVSWMCLMVFFYSVIFASCVRSAWVSRIKGKRRDLIHKNVSTPGRVGSSSSASPVRRVGSSSSASSVHSLAKASQSPRLCRLSSDTPSQQSNAATMPGRFGGCDETQFYSRSSPCVTLPPPALTRLSSGSRYFAQIVRQRSSNAKTLLD